jgi:glycosyltransferase involved in cell wall biosynthesis
MKRILVFSTAYFPFAGGAEIAVKEITKRLSSDFSFDLITARLKSDLARNEKVGEVNVYRIGFGVPFLDKLLLPFWGAVKAKNLKARNNYTAYWCVMVSFAPGAAYIANIFSREKIPIVLTLQEGDSEKYLKTRRLGLVDLSWRLALKRSALVTVISSYLGERARRLGHRGKIILVPNGVDFNKFSLPISKTSAESLKKKYNKKNNELVIITISRLVKKNAIDDLIRSLAELPEHLKLWIIGDGQEREVLERIVNRMRLEHRVSFLGEMKHEDLPPMLQISDVFVRPSRSEGFGNAFIESMAAGIPVVATPVGGIVDFLFDPDKNPNKSPTGLYCEVDNASSIAFQVKRLLESPALRNQVVISAKRLVKEKYDWNHIVELMSSKVFKTF